MTTTFTYYRGGSSVGYRTDEAPVASADMTFDVTLTKHDGMTAYRLTERAIGARPAVFTDRGDVSHSVANQARAFLASEGISHVNVQVYWDLTEPPGFRTPAALPSVNTIGKGKTVKLYGRWNDPDNPWSLSPGRGMIATTFLAIEQLYLEVNADSTLANDINWLIEYGWLKPAGGTVPTYIAA